MADTREKLIKLLASKPELLKNLNVNISKLYKLADHLIANGVTVGDKWVSTAERLPEESGEYLVYTARGNRMEMDYSAKYKQFNMFDDGIGTPIACTYWMPLPEPPKGE
jgi:hypothetical protein